MKFKLIIAMAEDDLTETVIETARAHGATGSTVITSARGEGLKPSKSFLGLSITGQRNMILLLVEEHKAREILEGIGAACRFDADHGAGVAFQIDIEDAIGLKSQIESIGQEISEEDL